MIIGTAGHIDHGKTSLVKAITGVDADRLKEEKARGITIDLGFAYWPQADGTSIGFVDVPGHEGYIHNMLAGVTGIAALMLVVAANDGIRPQTLEHLLIADMLGLTQGMVALTKIDLVDADTIAQRQTEISALLVATGLKNAPIIPVSTVTGEGMGALKQALQTLQLQALQLQAFQQHDRVAHKPLFRMPIDRIFSVQGAGTVVTGAILSGAVAVDDKMVLSPSGKDVRVRSIHAQNRRALGSFVGERAAVNLAGVSIDDAKRGDVLLPVSLHGPTLRFDASFNLAASEAKPLATWTAVHLHCGTGAWTARVVPLSAGGQLHGEGQLVQLVTDRPAALFGGDRFILRDASAQRTLGGGTILDIDAPERNRRKPERLHVLGLIRQFGAVDALPHLVNVAPYAMDITLYARKHALAVEAFAEIIKTENLLRLSTGTNHFIFSPPIFLKIARQIQHALAAHHSNQPDQMGMTIQRLRLALPERLSPGAFSALVAHSVRRGEVAATGAFLRLPSHVPRLSPEHEMLWAQVQLLLEGDNRFKPPRINELAEQLQRRDETLRGLMKRLARRGDVDEVAVDHFLLRSAVAELAQTAVITGKASMDGWFNAAAFRDQLGIGRKMAILILEFFDRQGMTIRKGDMRKVDPAKARMFAAEGF